MRRTKATTPAPAMSRRPRRSFTGWRLLDNRGLAEDLDPEVVGDVVDHPGRHHHVGALAIGGRVEAVAALERVLGAGDHRALLPGAGAAHGEAQLVAGGVLVGHGERAADADQAAVV